MDDSERTRREQEGILKARERLKFRVYQAVRGVVLATELFRSHPSLFEPEIAINVYPEAVDVYTSLTEGQLRLVPAGRRVTVLRRFGDELRDGLSRLEPSLDLEFTSSPEWLGGSRPLLLAGLPAGFRAVLRRRDPEAPGAATAG